MKEQVLSAIIDIIKWGLVLIIAGVVFYVVYPKYYFSGPQGIVYYRCNKINGQVESYDKGTGWELLQKETGLKGHLIDDIGVFDKAEKDKEQD